MAFWSAATMPMWEKSKTKAHLRQHLRQPGLTVEGVARTLGLSASQVHRVFAGEGCTLMEWLWRQRLEGAGMDLSGIMEQAPHDL